MVKGTRVRLIRWVHAARCVVRVEVDAIVPDGDPSEPSLEPATFRWLDELQRWADAGEFDRLAAVGDVYVRRSA